MDKLANIVTENKGNTQSLVIEGTTTLSGGAGSPTGKGGDLFVSPQGFLMGGGTGGSEAAKVTTGSDSKITMTKDSAVVPDAFQNTIKPSQNIEEIPLKAIDLECEGIVGNGMIITDIAKGIVINIDKAETVNNYENKNQ